MPPRRREGRRGRLLLAAVAVAVALATVCGLKSSALAADGVSFVVTSTTDAADANIGNGACSTASGACTLRAAIQETNALPGADAISLPAGTYELAIAPLNQNLAGNGDLDITGSVAIVGSGAGSTFVDGGTPKAGAPVQAHGLDRLFEITADGAAVSFTDLTLQEGWADEHGGAVMNSSSAAITVIGSTLRRNGAGKTGGAIDNHFGGTLAVRGSTLSDNYAAESGSAINNNRGGALTVADSVVSSNSAADAGLDENLVGAGAIANNAELDAIGTITVTDSVIADNRAAGGRPGAGLSNDGAGVVVVTDTSFDRNRSLADGGALFNNNGLVTVAESTFSENAADNGGAISSTGLGSIEVLDSVFTKNSATDWGGALHNGNKGSVSIRSSLFTENSALNGGGFGNEGSGLVVVESSSFTKNSAIDTALAVGGEGGGMHSSSGGEVVVTGGSFTENQALAGGGLSNEGGGSVTVTGTRVAANRALEAGGGVLIQSGAVRMVGVDVVGNISDSPLEGGGGISYGGDKAVAVGESAAIELSRIRDNTSQGDGGGIDSRGDGPLVITTTSITGNSALIGGAIHHVGDAPLVVDRSTLSGNTAENGGGVFSDGDGEATIENSTLSGNRASQFGGGLLVSARVVVRSSTISANSASSGGGVNNGGGDLIGDGSVFLANAIVSGNPAGGNCAGTVTSLGGNLESTSTCQLIELSDQPGTDPRLGPLRDNGGPTQTHALLPGSPAQEAAVCTDVDPCPTVDQRGITRPIFPAADAGAYESETTPGDGGGTQACSGRTERPVRADYDSWVSQSSPSTNRGTDAILDVQSQGSTNARALLHFALPPMPPGCKLVGAALRIYSSAATDGRTLEARRLTAPWTELGVTWSNQPAAAGAAAPTESGLGIREWNVIAQTLEMYASGAHGFVVGDAEEGQSGSQSFHSREKGAEQPPELVLVFDDPDGTPSPDNCATMPQSFAADSDSWVSQASSTNNFGTDSSLKVKSQTGSNSRALVRFPLPALPGGCTSIASATLTLDASSAKEGRTLDALRIASPWTENGVTWANQPAIAGPAASTPSIDGPLSWDVTTQVLDMYTSANHGFQIRDATENGVGDEQTLNGRLKIGDFPPELVVVFDNSTPETSLLGPSSPTAEIGASFTFSSDRADATFECSLDGAPFAGCASPHALSGLAEGEHRLDVRAKRPVRAVDPTPASHAWTIAIPPQTTLAGPASPSASADAQLSFFADDPGATFECSLDGEPWASCSSAVEYTNLADGERELAVRATDQLGNVEPVPARHAWTIAVPPQTTIDSAPGALSNDASPSFAFSGTDNGPASPALTFECRLDGGALEPCTSRQDYDALADGEHTFSVRATDAAGNEDASAASRTWTIDTLAPETSIDSGPKDPGNDATPTFSFSASEEASFRCALDETAFAACTSPVTTAALAEGEHTFLVEATDAAGNVEAEAASVSFGVDLTSPETSITDSPPALTNDPGASFSFTSTETGSTFACSLDDGAATACTSAASYTELTDGEHAFSVRSTDAAGNEDGSAATFRWTVDTVAPETSIASGPTALTNDSGAEFTFTATESGSSFACSLDGGAATACTSAASYTDLTDGEHAFSVTATDAAGNEDASAASRTWTIDTVAPETSIVSGPAGLTNDSDASFPFASTESESRFACSLDAGLPTPCASPALYTGLADGEHTFSVVATDAAGNEDASAASRTWTIDTLAPESSIDSGPADPGNDATPTFVFSASEEVSFRCALDEEPLAACTSPVTTEALAEGEHTFLVEASDAAGNVEAEAASVTFTVDLTAPTTTFDSRPADPGNDATPTFHFSASEDASFRCSLDEESYTPCTSPFTTEALAEAAHTFSVEATDVAGNVEGEPASDSFVVDLTAPATSITAGPTGLTKSSGASFSFTSSETGSTFACSLDGAMTACTSPASYTALADGEHTFSVRATDTAGNADASVASRTWTIDTLAPDTSIGSGPDDPGNDATPTFAFLASEDASFRCALDAATFTACTSPLTSEGLAEGEHTFFVEATDAAGNVEAEAASLSFTVDLTAPETAIAIGPPALTNDSSASFSFTSTETSSTFACSLDGATTACTSAASYTELTEGEHAFSVRATDAAGNEDPSAPTWTWTVDTVAPESSITDSPPDLTKDTDASFAFASTETGSALACSLDGAAFSVCESPETYGGLGDGRHTFAVRATDTAGNPDATPAERTWTIDTTPPLTSIVSGPPATTTDTSATFELEASEPGATFACALDGGSYAVCTSPHEVTGLGLGSHTLEVRAIDGAGNTDATPASRTWTVRAADTTEPETTITAGPTGPTNDATPTFGFSANEPATFECRIDSNPFVACSSPHTTSPLTQGTHTFEVGATDSVGLSDATPASRTFVVDTVAPETTITAGPPATTSSTAAEFELTSTETGSSFECSLDGSGFAPCSSPVSYTVTVGPHELEVRATDAAGNVDESPDSHAWTVQAPDTAPPDTTITAGPSGLTSDSTPAYEFTASETATFQCRVDAASFAPCSSPHTTATLSDGEHTFEVRAVDASGNADGSPASRSLTVDTVAPQTTITDGPPATTTSTHAELEFTSTETGSSFECSLDGAGFSPCSSPVTYTVAIGSHAFEVQARDAAGNTDDTSASRAWTVHAPDTTPPDTTITGGPSGPTNDTTPTYTFTASEAATFQCRVDTASYAPCSSPHTTATLTQGPHTFEVRALDSAGNVDTSPAGSGITVDTVAPQTTITAGPAATTSSTTAQFEFTSTEIGSSFECSLDGAPFASCSSPATYTVALGSHQFEVRARDAAGNPDAIPASSSWTVQPGDSSPPQTTITGGPTGPTSDSTPTFTFSSSESGSSFQCRVDSGVFASCTTPHTTASLNQGAHAFEVRARDAAGNFDLSPASRDIVVDTVAPQTTITAGPTGPTNDSTPTFEFSASETATFQCRVDTASFTSCSSPHTTASQSSGSHTFQVRAIDSAGIVDSTPASRAFTVDTTVPNTTITQAPPATTSNATVSFQFNSNETGASFECSLDGSGFVPCSSPVSYTVSPGPHQFQARARDAAGNVDASPASASWTYQVADTTPPDTTITNGPPATTANATVSFEFTSTETGSSFECSLDGSGFAPCFSPVTYTVAAGSHEFQVRARDAAGNVDSSPASRSWTREEPPPGSCSPSTVTLGASADSWVLQSSSTSNYGADSVIKVDSKAGAGARALVRFSLPALAAGCQVLDAELRLYASSSKTGRTIDVYAVTSTWGESSVTWSSQPAPAGSASPAASGSGYVEWNVTAQLASTYATNNGFLVRDRIENNGGVEQGYHSREKGTDNPPQLVVTVG